MRARTFTLTSRFLLHLDQILALLLDYAILGQRLLTPASMFSVLVRRSFTYVSQFLLPGDVLLPLRVYVKLPCAIQCPVRPASLLLTVLGLHILTLWHTSAILAHPLTSLALSGSVNMNQLPQLHIELPNWISRMRCACATAAQSQSFSIEPCSNKNQHLQLQFGSCSFAVRSA